MASSQIRVQDYDGTISDVAFDIMDADSLLAGVASRIMRRTGLDSAHRLLLNKSLLEGTCWILASGARADLVQYPEFSSKFASSRKSEFSV
jgi:hypothetical protein